VEPDQKAELLDILRRDHPDLAIEHLGRLRVRVMTGRTTLVVGLNDEDYPKDWARVLNKLLNNPAGVLA
jgi:hypothetical protein